jgi:hypothetical protein
MALTKKQVEKATKIVNAWFDSWNQDGWLNDKYHPEGRPNFVPNWDWGCGEAATFIYEGYPVDEWVHRCANDIQPELKKVGVFCEPYTSFALSIYDNR